MRRIHLLVLVLFIAGGFAWGILGPSRQSLAVPPAVTVELAAGLLRPGTGHNGNVQVWVKNVPGPSGLGAYDLKVNFDPARIKLNSITGGSTSPFDQIDITHNLVAANSSGELKFNAFQSARPGPVGNVHVATVNISALTAGQHPFTPAAITITLADVQGTEAAGTAVPLQLQAYDPPVASFSASPTSGRVPLLVNFTDLSAGPATAWSWDLNGNGTADSSTKNPTFNYTQPGNYSVSLTAQNPQGADTKTVPAYIRAYDTPNAGFSADKTRGRAPLTVNFSDESTGNIAAWEWDLNGDGSADSSSKNPTYRYTRAGKYTVTLRATNPVGNDTRTRTNYIQVKKLKVKKSFKIEKDDDGIIVLPIDIGDLTDPDTAEKIKPNKGIKEFSGEVNFGQGMSMLGGRKGGANFNDPTMNNSAGKTSFSGSSKNQAKHDTETRIAKLVPRLTGAKDALIEIVLNLHSVVEGDEESDMEEEAPTSLFFRRGAARGRDSSNITDALFIAQYLAGLRNDSELNLLNAASIKPDSGNGDKVAITDALYLAQFLAGLRDSNFNFP